MGKYNWDKLKDNLQKGVGDKSENNFDDPREWKLQKDDQGSGTAVIRLLPGRGGDTPPIVRLYEHSVRVFNKASNKYRYYIEPSPATIGLDCPVSSIYYELGDLGTEEGKKAQEVVSRSVKFISNILVVNDPANPENNGKIFFWKYGVKLFEKFQQALEPTESQLKVGKKPIELFDPESGADIILEVSMQANFPDFSGTSISSPSRAFKTEREMDEAVLEKCYDLTEFISEEYFKPYGELKKKLAWVLEKSSIESLLIENNSAVITEFYTKAGNKNSNAAKESNEVQLPKVKTREYKPKEHYEDSSNESNESNESKESKEEKLEQDKKPSSSQKQKQVETEDEIMAMLDSL